MMRRFSAFSSVLQSWGCYCCFFCGLFDAIILNCLFLIQSWVAIQCGRRTSSLFLASASTKFTLRTTEATIANVWTSLLSSNGHNVFVILVLHPESILITGKYLLTKNLLLHVWKSKVSNCNLDFRKAFHWRILLDESCSWCITFLCEKQMPSLPASPLAWLNFWKSAQITLEVVG